MLITPNPAGRQRPNQGGKERLNRAFLLLLFTLFPFRNKIGITTNNLLLMLS
jgi:hypothetical protein